MSHHEISGGVTARMAPMDSRMARIWFSVARQKARASRACGYHAPYSVLNRAVVRGSFTGVKRQIHG